MLRTLRAQGRVRLPLGSSRLQVPPGPSHWYVELPQLAYCPAGDGVGSSPPHPPGACIGEPKQHQEAGEGTQGPGNLPTPRAPSSSLSGQNPAVPASPDWAEFGVELPLQDVCFLGASQLVLCSENYSLSSVCRVWHERCPPATYTLDLYFNLQIPFPHLSFPSLHLVGETR